MPVPFADKRSSTTRRRAVLLVSLLFAALCGLTLLGGRAPAQDLRSKLEHKQAQLSDVKNQQDDVAASIAESNQQVNDLIAQVAALRDQTAAVREELAAKQAQLDKTIASLEVQRKHLEVLRSRLRRALGVLSDELVGIYESGDPDVLSVILDSASWSDVVAQTDYLNSLQSHFDSVVERVRSLRNETRRAVDRLRAARERIEAQRDAIAARERQLEDMQAVMEKRHAELVSLRAARQAKLDSLEGRAQALEDNLSSISDQLESASVGTGTAQPPPVPGASATLLGNGLAAAPASAPPAVKSAIEAANQIATTPYIWGGGHGSWSSSGYDCSGAVSYALHGGGFLDSPLDSTGLETWGVAGPGSWITVYANAGHAFAVIAGLRWDTSGDATGTGPRWHTDMASTAGFIARHPDGY
jgi:peptidoglycan hydrolase CwlO-like protein